jgi:hypothetical protein
VFGPGDKGTSLIVIEPRYDQIPMYTLPLPIRFVFPVTFEKGVKHPTPPFYKAPVVKNMLLLIFNTSREKVLRLSACEKINDQLL